MLKEEFERLKKPYLEDSNGTGANIAMDGSPRIVRAAPARTNLKHELRQAASQDLLGSFVTPFSSASRILRTIRIDLSERKCTSE